MNDAGINALRRTAEYLARRAAGGDAEAHALRAEIMRLLAKVKEEQVVDEALRRMGFETTDGRPFADMDAWEEMP